MEEILLPKILNGNLEFMMNKRVRDFFYQLSGASAFDLSQLVSYVSIIPADAFNTSQDSNENTIEEHSLDFASDINDEFYKKTIFMDDNSRYKYRGLLELQKLEINVHCSS